LKDQKYSVSISRLEARERKLGSRWKGPAGGIWNSEERAASTKRRRRLTSNKKKGKG